MLFCKMWKESRGSRLPSPGNFRMLETSSHADCEFQLTPELRFVMHIRALACAVKGIADDTLELCDDTPMTPC